LKTLMSIEEGAIVVFIHPLHARLNRWLVKMLTRKNVQVVCMIGDINGLKDGDAVLLKKEIAQFRRFKYFIVHNHAMEHWLQQNLPGSKATTIEFFDFLTDKVRPVLGRDNSITFAGN